jgi:hypothetical protein
VQDVSKELLASSAFFFGEVSGGASYGTRTRLAARKRKITLAAKRLAIDADQKMLRVPMPP